MSITADELLAAIGDLVAKKKAVPIPAPVVKMKRKVKATEKQAVALISEMIKDGPVLAAELYKKLWAANCSTGTINRARKTLGIVSLPVPGQRARFTRWYLRSQLPTAPVKPAQTPETDDGEGVDSSAATKRHLLRIHERISAQVKEIGVCKEQIREALVAIQANQKTLDRIMREFVNTNPPPPELVLGGDHRANGHVK